MTDQTYGEKAGEKVADFLGIVILCTWIAFCTAPFLSYPGLRWGIFVPSPEWLAQEWKEVARGTIIGLFAFALALGMTFASLRVVKGLYGGQPSDTPQSVRRLLKYGLWGLFLLLPLWGWGFEQGTLRVWAHEDAPTLERVTTTAVVSSYYVAKARARYNASTFVCHRSAGFRPLRFLT